MNLHRSLHAVRTPARPVTRGQSVQKWAALAEPVMPQDTQDRMRAQSLLTCACFRYRDGSTNPNTLTLAQAQDVLRWATGAQL